MNQFTVYAKKEPTTDEILLKYAPEAKRNDVVIYGDKKCKNKKAVYPWHRKSKPDRRNKWINLNCFRYRLEWI